MGTKIFLGMPPPRIKRWIIDHSGPVIKPETHIKFVDGTEGDYLIERTMDCPALIAAGLMPPGSGTEAEPSWITQPLKVNIGSAVTSIGEYAFNGCSGLADVAIPNSVTSIGDYAFHGCSGLAGVAIPQFVCSSSMRLVFPDAYQTITNIVILDGVTSIGKWAFLYCGGFTSVTIPDSVTSIESEAFRDCSGLTSVEFEGNAPTVGE